VSRVGWSVEQRAKAKRLMIFVAVFGVAAIALSIGLIITGNSSGWILLGLAACIVTGTFLLYANVKKSQP